MDKLRLLLQSSYIKTLSIFLLKYFIVSSIQGLSVSPEKADVYNVLNSVNVCKSILYIPYVHYKIPLCALVFPSGSAVEQFPWYLWWAVADVHCSGGCWICQGHPGEHAQHSGHWPVNGCSQTAVHCPHGWESPLLLPWWEKMWSFPKCFHTNTIIYVSLMCVEHSTLPSSLCFSVFFLFPQSLAVFCCRWFYIISICICASRGSCSSALGSLAASFP